SGNLYGGTNVVQRQRHDRRFRLHAAGNAAQRTAEHAAQRSAEAADGIVVDDDLRFQIIVGSHTLAFMLLGACTIFARTALLLRDLAQAAVGAKIADRRDDEAVRLLNGQAQ